MPFAAYVAGREPAHPIHPDSSLNPRVANCPPLDRQRCVLRGTVQNLLHAVSDSSAKRDSDSAVMNKWGVQPVANCMT